ncbi:unnamed protein product, partial [Dibothriocephalus latus]
MHVHYNPLLLLRIPFPAAAVSFHDIISVGAFSTASTRYKCRGLFQTAFSNASGDVGQPFPPSPLSLADFADCLPSTAAVLQLESHKVGVAIKRLADGAALVVQLHSDLGELKTRLQAVGQAVLLTERLDDDVSAFFAKQCEVHLARRS